MRKAYQILGREPEGKRLLGRHGNRWVDSLKVGLREIVHEGVDLSGPGYGPAEISCEPRSEPLSYKR